MSFLFIFSIVGISWGFRKKFKVLEDFDLLFSISFLVSIIYFFGFFKLLAFGNYLISFIGIILFIKFLNEEKDKFYKKRYGYFIILSFFIFVFSQFLQFNLWDEFFWAQYTKSIFYEKKIYDAFSILQNHPRYTPGLPIYQNYFSFIFEKFNDKTLIFTNLILVLSYCFIFFQKKFWMDKKIFIKVNIIIFFPIIILFSIFSFGYLYVEFYISILLSTILIFISKNLIKIDSFFILIPFLIFFLLIKETTIIFVPLILFLIILINYKNNGIGYYLFCLVTICLIIKFSWNYYVSEGGASNNSDSLLYNSIENFFSNFINYFPTYINSFTKVILDYGQFTSVTRKLGLPDFTTLTWFVISFLLLISNLKSIRKNNKKIKMLISIYLFSIFYYLFVFFIDFVFWQGKPVHFNRLSSSFLVTVLLINIFTFYDLNFFNKYFKQIVALLFIILSFSIFNSKFIKNNFHNYYSKQKVLNNKIIQIRDEAYKIKSIINNKSKIYFIHQKSSGFERTVFNYYIYPHEVNSTSWSLGVPYNKIDNDFEDIWSTNLSKNQLIDRLENDIPYRNKFKNCCKNIALKRYDHMYLNNKDEKLWKNISFLFLNKNDYLNNKFFKISYENNFPILEPIF